MFLFNGRVAPVSRPSFWLCGPNSIPSSHSLGDPAPNHSSKSSSKRPAKSPKGKDPRRSTRRKAVDKALVNRARKGDEKAFEELIARYEKLVRLVVSRGANGIDVIEDVVQDTFLKAFAHLSSLERPGLFKSWILQIATNRSRDYVRKEARLLRFLKEASTCFPHLSNPLSIALRNRSGHPGGEALERKESQGLIVQELLRLPSRYKKIAVLRYLSDYSMSEIAKELNLDERLVKQRLWRARIILQRRLSRRRLSGRHGKP